MSLSLPLPAPLSLPRSLSLYLCRSASPRWRVKNIATHPFVVVVAVVCVSHLIFMHAHVLLFSPQLLLLLLYFLFACLMFVLCFPNGFICGSASAHLAAVAPSRPATPRPATARATHLTNGFCYRTRSAPLPLPHSLSLSLWDWARWLCPDWRLAVLPDARQLQFASHCCFTCDKNAIYCARIALYLPCTARSPSPLPPHSLSLPLPSPLRLQQNHQQLGQQNNNNSNSNNNNKCS